MENKIVLYNSDNVKIGETYLRQARQLIRQQRAVWVDENESKRKKVRKLSFYFGDKIKNSAQHCQVA